MSQLMSRQTLRPSASHLLFAALSSETPEPLPRFNGGDQARIASHFYTGSLACAKIREVFKARCELLSRCAKKSSERCLIVWTTALLPDQPCAPVDCCHYAAATVGDSAAKRAGRHLVSLGPVSSSSGSRSSAGIRGVGCKSETINIEACHTRERRRTDRGEEGGNPKRHTESGTYGCIIPCRT